MIVIGNRCEPEEYVVLNFLFGLVAISYAQNVRPLPGMSMLYSARIFVIMVWCSLSLGLLKSFSKERNIFTAFFYFVTPLGLYSIAANFDRHRLILAALILVFVSLLIYLLVRIKKEIRHKKRAKIARHGAIRLTVFCLCISSLIATGILNKLSLGKSYTIGEAAEVTAVDFEKLSFLGAFEEDAWRDMGEEERQIAIINLASYEAAYLGLQNGIQLAFKEMPENVLGTSNTKDSIYINCRYLSEYSPDFNAHGAMQTVCHELYHLYEGAIVEASEHISEKHKRLLKFRSVDIYRMEIDNYVHSSDNLMDYYTQKLESDARAYSNFKVEDYYYIMRNYLAVRDY